jgi:hypothetical protein
MMKMNWTLSAILAAGSYVMTAPRAQAQQPYHATFTLPVAAHFGGAILEPGEYTVAALEGTSAIRITGSSGTVTILASSIDNEAGSDRGKITLKSVNGAFALTRLDAGTAGRRFDFVLPKNLRMNPERAAIGQTSALEIGLK